MTAPAGARGADRPTRQRPPQLGRLAWVAWRQQRATLIGLAVFLALVAVFALDKGLGAHSSGASAHQRCLVAPIGFTCAALFEPVRAAELTMLVPIVVGVFLGAPLLARDYASGTTRFAWTQGTGRTRLAVTRMALLGLAVLIAAGLLGWLTWWALQPIMVPGTGEGFFDRWQSLLFAATPLSLAGSTLLGSALGVLAGALTRRVVPAMACTMVAVLALAWVNVTPLHDRLLSLGVQTTRDTALGVWPDITASPSGLFNFHQVVTTGTSGPRGSWLDQGWYTGPNGLRISGDAVARLKGLTLQQLSGRHVTFWITYQPAGRYWLFQSAQAGAELLLALILGALALWLVRHRIG